MANALPYLTYLLSHNTPNPLHGIWVGGKIIARRMAVPDGFAAADIELGLQTTQCLCIDL